MSLKLQHLKKKIARHFQISTLHHIIIYKKNKLKKCENETGLLVSRM